MQSFPQSSPGFVYVRLASINNHSVSSLFSRSFVTMATRSMEVVVLLLLLVASAQTSKCGNVAAATPSAKNQIRKLLHGQVEMFKRGFGSLDSHHHEKDVVNWDLRKVPSGPDPLHHNVGGPKKPITP